MTHYHIYSNKRISLGTVIRMAFFILLSSFFISCGDDPHEGERGLAVTLDNSRCPDVPIGAITLCIYGTDGNLAATYDYADARSIAAALLTEFPAGHYTVCVVINATPEADALCTLTALHEWLEAEATTNRQLLSAMTEVDVTAEGISRAYVTLYPRAFPLPVLRLLLTLPDPKLPDYTPTKTGTRAAGDTYIIRCVAELVKAGTDNVVLHKSVTPEAQADGTCLVELSVPTGTYDLRLWTDYALSDNPLSDTYYHTESLKAVSIVTEPYTANTDAKDAAYHNESNITLPEEGTTINVQLQRPLAKYRIIADDVEAYRKLTETAPQKYPPLEGLAVTVQYENFFPSEFNAAGGKVTDALTGIGYTTSLTGTGTDTSELVLASDWVMAGSTESSVTIQLTINDAGGNTICQVKNTNIGYKQGHLTTIRGKFLTAGVNNGGVIIDTNWEDIIIEF